MDSSAHAAKEATSQHAWDTRPTGDGGGWRVYLDISKSAAGQQSGTVYVMCLR